MAHVLIVEDDPWIREVMLEDLADRGHDVQAVANGAAALRHVGHDTPDVLVLDLVMPEMTGWEFLAHYKEATCGVGVPIIVVSAANSTSVGEQGVHCVLRKPFDVERLAEAVAEAAAGVSDRGRSPQGGAHAPAFDARAHMLM